MEIADMIPGISGNSIALIFGIYPSAPIKPTHSWVG